MKKTAVANDNGYAAHGDGGGERGGKSLRNRRRRVIDGGTEHRPPAAATVTSGALHRLQAADGARDPAVAVADDWLFADWLDGGAAAPSATGMSGAHIRCIFIYYPTRLSPLLVPGLHVRFHTSEARSVFPRLPVIRPE